VDSPLEGTGFEPAVPGESGFDFAREVRDRTESKKAIRRASVARPVASHTTGTATKDARQGYLSSQTSSCANC